MATQFQVYHDHGGEWRWRLIADNHQTVATSSESYRAKVDCLNSIDILKRGAATLGMYQDKSQEWRWRAIHPNGKTIATSGEGYVAKSSCEAGLLWVKERAKDAPIAMMDAPVVR